MHGPWCFHGWRHDSAANRTRRTKAKVILIKRFVWLLSSGWSPGICLFLSALNVTTAASGWLTYKNCSCEQLGDLPRLRAKLGILNEIKKTGCWRNTGLPVKDKAIPGEARNNAFNVRCLYDKMHSVPRLPPSSTQGLREEEKKGGGRCEQRRMGEANGRDGGGQTKKRNERTKSQGRGRWQENRKTRRLQITN